MKITVKEQAGLRHDFSVEIDAAEVEHQLETELQSIGARAKIPGFRPGKIPMNVLKQRYGKDSMEKVLWDCVNVKTRELMDEKGIRPALQPDVSVSDYNEGESLKFDVSVEAMPDVPEIGYDSINVTQFTFDVDEKEVEEGLERLAAQQKHTHETKEGTKAKLGDIVKIDFLGKLGGEPFDGGKGEGFQLELGSNQFIPGFEEQLVDSKAGDAVEVKVTFPEEYHSSDLAGKDATFDVTVHEVLHQHTPDIDDKLAENVGFETLDALKDAIRQQVSGDYEAAAHNKAKKELFDLLDEQIKFDVPAKMVELEFENVWQQLQEAKAKGDESVTGKSDDELKEEYGAVSERRVRLGILLAEIGRKNHIQVTNDELTQAVMAQARMFPGQEQKVFEFYQQNPKHVDELKGPILEDKAVEFILGKVNRTEKKVDIDDLFKAEGEEEPKKEAKKSEKKETKKKSASKKKKAD